MSSGQSGTRADRASDGCDTARREVDLAGVVVMGGAERPVWWKDRPVVGIVG